MLGLLVAMAALDLDHLDKVYPGGRQALADVTLGVGDGELMVLVGPSGCGKSTLLRVVAGLEEPTRGRVLISGQVVNDRTPQQRNVAMVFQDYALYPHMTARQNLEFPLKMRRASKGEMAKRVESISRALEIERWLDRLPRELSGGERQRVAMGRALVREPSVSLLDEPLSNLDARLRVQVRSEIKELQRRIGTTMVYVTHDQVEAMTLGDRVAVLDRGRLQQVSPPSELYATPRNSFVAGFIGNPPMNLFPARLAVRGGELGIVVGGSEVSIAPPRLDRSALDALSAGPVTAGARPESIRVVAGKGVGATVEHVENLGHESLLHVSVASDGVSNMGRAGEPESKSGSSGPVRWVVRVDGMTGPARGERLSLALDPARVHLFDASGAALTHV